jgi:hypothetical protein
VNETSLKNDGIEKGPFHGRLSSFRVSYLPSFFLDSLAMMYPEMVIASMRSANVMNTPEKPKANTLRAELQSVIGSVSMENGKILQKPSDNYNGLGEYLGVIGSNCLAWEVGSSPFPLSVICPQPINNRVPQKRGIPLDPWSQNPPFNLSIKTDELAKSQKLQMQGLRILRSEAYLPVRRNDER